LFEKLDSGSSLRSGRNDVFICRVDIGETVKSSNSVTPVKTGVQNQLKKLNSAAVVSDDLKKQYCVSNFHQNEKKGKFQCFTSSSILTAVSAKYMVQSLKNDQI
jgi:hypothetical protein